MKNKMLLLLIFLFMSCSLPTVPTQDSISATTSDNELEITNRGNKTIYLFVVEQKVAARIDWSPHFSKPNVDKYNSIKINYTDIYNGSNNSVTVRDRIIIYYWDDTDKTKPEINSKIIQL